MYSAPTPPKKTSVKDLPLPEISKSQPMTDDHTYSEIELGGGNIYESLDEVQSEYESQLSSSQSASSVKKGKNQKVKNSKEYQKAIKSNAKPVARFLKAASKFDKHLDSHAKLLTDANTAFTSETKDLAQGYRLMRQSFDDWAPLQKDLQQMEKLGESAALIYANLMTSQKNGDIAPAWVEKLETWMNENQERCKTVRKYLRDCQAKEGATLQEQTNVVLKLGKDLSKKQDKLHRAREG